MKRFWKLFHSTPLAIWLLCLVSLSLFVGAIVSIVYEEELKQLNFMPVVQWIGEFGSQPQIYWWIVIVFIILALLALNTLLCTWASVRHGQIGRKAGSILLHLAFLVILSAHGISEISGASQSVIIQPGVTKEVAWAGLTIVPAKIEKYTQQIGARTARMGMMAELIVHDKTSQWKPLRPATLKPAFAHGLSFHLSLFDKDLEKSQARLIIRRDCSRSLFISGAVLALAGIAFYVPSILRRKQYQG